MFSTLCEKLRASVIENLPATTSQSLMSELCLFPNPDGSRYISEYYEKMWKEQISKLYVAEAEFARITAELSLRNPDRTLRIPKITVQSVCLEDDIERFLSPFVIMELKKLNAITVEGTHDLPILLNFTRKFPPTGFYDVSIY